MSRRDAKLLARHWADEPDTLARDLKTLIEWIEENALKTPVEPAAQQRGAVLADASVAGDVIERLEPMESALHEYRRLMPPTHLNTELLQPITEAFSAAAENQADVTLENFAGIRNEVASFERQAVSQTQKMSWSSNRSELLKATIEEADGEILVRTDTNGSLKLRGSASIPMFLALWRAPKHRLSQQAFLDIDRSTNQKNMDRHRARLCSRLQSVLLEVVADESGVRMQKCR